MGEQPDCCPRPATPPPVEAAAPQAPALPPAAPAEPAAPGPVTIGVILPRTGPAYLQQYADLLLQGIRIAARESHRQVDLVVLDDGGLPDGDSALVVEARERGAVAIIGPMLSAGVRHAAYGRDGTLPALVSPTASEVPGEAANIYTLNGVDLRGPRALAEYAIRGGLGTAAILYSSESGFSQQAWAFGRAFQELGGRVATMVPYDSGTTSFGTHVGRVLDSRPDVVYVPLPPQDIQLLAPQLAYYGFRGSSVVFMGNESWTDEEVLRQVSTRFTDRVVASSVTPRMSGEAGWEDFVRPYEEAHRRSLDNPFPALGYDAMRLVLHALDDGANTPTRVAERLAQVRAFRGATGVLSIEDGVIARAPFLYRVLDGRLTPPPPPEQLRWPLTDSTTATTHRAE